MNKVEEDTGSEIYTCRRCNQPYCSECNPEIEVDFYVREGTENVQQTDRVCPFCYNQLVRKYEKLS